MFLGGNVLWPGVQKCLERKVRPIQICLIISNDGIRIVQMGQIRKRDFVQADHVRTLVVAATHIESKVNGFSTLTRQCIVKAILMNQKRLNNFEHFLTKKLYKAT